MSDTAAEVPAGWHPDPHGRHELRYWDGSKWSDHVSNGGVTSKDPARAKKGLMSKFEDALAVGNTHDAEKIKGQVSAGGRRGAGQVERAQGGAGSLFDEPILVVNQKTKVIELHNQYSVFDQDGNVIAIVDQIGQSSLKQAARLVSSLDQFMTHKMQITDPAGNVLMHLTRPKKLVKSSVIVSDADDNEIGRIVQKKAIGKIRFGLESKGETIGMIKAENWRAWNFRIEDANDREVARITKTWEGFARTAFTTADNYVVQISERMAEPLNSLIIASALSVDTALKQDNRGLN
ncbi:MAG: phospholipid scramblase-related protein [Ilumatobacteraceae bacterium]